jgi:hypothetical protein
MMDNSTAVPGPTRVALEKSWADAAFAQPKDLRQPDAFVRLVQRAEQWNHDAFSELEFRRESLANRPATEVPATQDLLRLQNAMYEFRLRVGMTVRVADEVGRAVQTITQRS